MDELVVLCQTYELLWDRLNEVCDRVSGRETFGCLDDLEAFVLRARDETAALKSYSNTLVVFAETTLRGYALHRRVDKLLAAHFLSTDDCGTICDHDWKTKRYVFLGVATQSSPGGSSKTQWGESHKLLRRIFRIGRTHSAVG